MIRRLVLAGLGLCAVTTSACGSPSGGAGAGEIQLGNLTGLLAQLNQSELQLDSATQVAVQQCMQHLGYIYYATQGSPPEAGIGSGSGNTVLGGSNSVPPLPSIGQAAVDGYGLYQEAVRNALLPPAQPGMPLDGPSTNREESYRESLSSSQATTYNSALFGPIGSQVTYNVPGIGSVTASNSGCVSQSQKQVYGSLQESDITINAVAHIAGSWQHLQDLNPQLRHLNGTWSGCMIDFGFKYSSPGAARQAVFASYANDGPTAANHRNELTVATKDFACRQRTGYMPGVTAVASVTAGPVLTLESGYILRIQERLKTDLGKLGQAVHSAGS